MIGPDDNKGDDDGDADDNESDDGDSGDVCFLWLPLQAKYAEDWCAWSCSHASLASRNMSAPSTSRNNKKNISAQSNGNIRCVSEASKIVVGTTNDEKACYENNCTRQ